MSKHGASDKPKQATNVFMFDGPDLKGKMHIANASNVQIGNGNVMVIQSGKRRTTTPRTKHIPEPPITDCCDVITGDDMDSMEQHLGSNWPTIARKLGFADGEIDIIREDYRGNLREQIHQMLRQWKEKEDARATVGALAKAIFSVPECAGVLKYLERNHPSDRAKPS